MTRPIIWALGAAVTAALYATVASDRLASKFRSGGSQPATAATAIADRPSPSGSPAAGDGTLVLNADLRGHYVAHAQIEGLRVRVLVDTGASFVALSYEDAQKAGIKVEARDFTLRMSTANGLAAAAPVRLREVRLGDIVVRDVQAIVCPKGALGTSLLGMSFLKRLGKFEVSQGRLTLRG